MLKRMTLLAKREDLDKAAFQQHWSGNHAQLALSLPGVCKYTQNRTAEVLMTYPETGAFSADGIVELFFTDSETMNVAQASETGSVKIPDDELLFLKGWSLNIVETLDPHDHSGAKVMVPLTLRDSNGVDRAVAAFTEAARGCSAEQISVNTVTSSHSRPRLWSEQVAPDVILVCWFASPEAARSAFEPGSFLQYVVANIAERASAYLCDPLVIK